MAKVPTKVTPGFRVRNPSTGEVKIWDGAKWSDVAAQGGTTPGRQLSPADDKVLKEMNFAARSAPEVNRLYDRVEPAIQSFNPGPFRGAIYDALIPQQGGGVMDKVGGVFGAIGRGLGVLAPEDIQNFGTIQNTQAQRVLEEQLKQKGVQSEGDALRMMLADIGPYKTPQENAALIANSRVKLKQAPMRARFYQQWAGNYGLTGLDAQGRDVETAFQEMQAQQQPPAAPQQQGAPAAATIRRIK